jgi:putative ABC transport system permease protein
MIASIVKLAFSGVRSRLLGSAVTILLMATATTTVVIALEVGATAHDPWQRTFDAANGAHVLADAVTETDARSLAGRPGVAEASAPIPSASAQAELPSGPERLLLAGLDTAPTVNVPIATDGTTVPGRGIVLEHSFADVAGLTVGDTVRVDGASGPLDVTVVGTAISPSQNRYPRQNPGLGWVSRDTLAAVRPDTDEWRWREAIRLADPATEQAFADAVIQSFPPRTVYVETAGDQRANALKETQPISLILTTYTLVILFVVLIVTGILIGARAAQQRREVALARAVGLTPRQVSAMFTIETATMGAAGVLLGCVVGVLAAPRLAAPAFTTLLGAPTVAVNPDHLVLAGVPILLVLTIGGWVSSRRWSRLSVVDAIRAGTPKPGSRSRLARLADRLGVSLSVALGLKDLLARRGRAALLVVALATTTATIVFALCMQTTLNARIAGQPSDVPNELPVLVYALDGVLLTIVVTTVVAVALLAVRERIHDFGVLRTIGFTPRQVSTSLVGAHTAVAALAALISIPIGIGLYIAVYDLAGGDSADLVIAPWWSLSLVPLAAAALVVGAAGPPAHISARTPITDAVRYE